MSATFESRVSAAWENTLAMPIRLTRVSFPLVAALFHHHAGSVSCRRIRNRAFKR